nr:hypothetical protein Iba_chr07bCG15640 [Ipomoea batatas]
MCRWRVQPSFIWAAAEKAGRIVALRGCPRRKNMGLFLVIPVFVGKGSALCDMTRKSGVPSYCLGDSYDLIEIIFKSSEVNSWRQYIRYLYFVDKIEVLAQSDSAFELWHSVRDTGFTSLGKDVNYAVLETRIGLVLILSRFLEDIEDAHERYKVSRIYMLVYYGDRTAEPHRLETEGDQLWRSALNCNAAFTGASQPQTPAGALSFLLMFFERNLKLGLYFPWLYNIKYKPAPGGWAIEGPPFEVKVEFLKSLHALEGVPISRVFINSGSALAFTISTTGGDFSDFMR